MKRVLFVVLTVLCFGVAAANADPGYRVEFSGDNAMSSCALANNGVGLTSIHMFMIGGASTTGVLFSAYIPACWGGSTWLGDVLAEPWLTIGTTQDAIGLTIAFGECRSLPLYLGAINFFGVAGASCCEFPVTHATAWDDHTTPALGVDCTFLGWEASGGRVIVNADASCPCQQPLAIEQSTWGAVKALYR
jgi:hypothetical protein